MLVLYAQGLLTGVVVDSGDGVTHIVPVWEGICPPLLIKRLNVAGRHITRHLIKLLQVRTITCCCCFCSVLRPCFFYTRFCQSSRAFAFATKHSSSFFSSFVYFTGARLRI
jgi:hypothetical protein